MTLPLRIQRLRDEARAPSYQTGGAAGLDVYACLDQPVILEPGARARVPTGLAVAVPPGHEAQVRPRSGLAARHGITVANAPGTIDEDYRGELQVLLINLGGAAYEVTHGDRIAQLVIAPVTRVQATWVDALEPTERGEGGFGSTGKGAKNPKDT